MEYKKNKFIIFFVFNIVLLLIVFLLAVPVSKFLSKINFEDNEFVKGQTVINPNAVSPKIIDRKINIKFIAKVNNSLNWEFKTLEDDINLQIGKNKIIKYEGKNLSNKTITSTAIFSATPEDILPYVIKTECFCFTEQTLKPGESKIFTLVFYLDPALDSVSNMNEIKELVFTYEFSEYKS